MNTIIFNSNFKDVDVNNFLYFYEEQCLKMIVKILKDGLKLKFCQNQNISVKLFRNK